MEKKRTDGDLDAAIEAMKRVPWTAFEQLKGDPEILKKSKTPKVRGTLASA